MPSDRCLPVCLSGTLVYCGQTVGNQEATWYGGRPRPCHIVLDGDPPSPRQKRAQPPIFGPCLLRPNGWMDQDATWYGGRPQLRQHGTQLPLPRGKGHRSAPLFTFRLECLVQWRTQDRFHFGGIKRWFYVKIKLF